MTREARGVRCPESILGWIPWYADGGLTDRQRGAVEAHAAECGDCRAEIDIVTGAPFEIDSELPDSDRLFREITARITASESDAAENASSKVIPIDRPRGTNDKDLRRIESWIQDESEQSMDEDAPGVIIGPWSMRSTWAAAAAIALFFLGAAGGGFLSSMSSGVSVDNLAGTRGSPAIYQSAAFESTLAAGGAASLAASPMLDVVFLDSATSREISKALRSLNVEIVSGPTSLGVYRLRLTKAADDDRPASSADVAAIAARLKAPDAAVAYFAEAVP